MNPAVAADVADVTSTNTPNSLRRQRYSISKRTSYAQQIERQLEILKAESAQEHDSDDDLELDLAKAALQTGNDAFEAQQWTEAESLLQEAMRALRQIPIERRAFCDMFSLYYKLAVCTYHLREPSIAEEALTSLGQHNITSNEQRERACDATHLLSQLYIRTGRIDLARRECEKTLQARRRLLGKRSDASLQSMALMAHIYILLDNRALAKTYLAMIPEERRSAVIYILGQSLETGMEHLNFSSVMQPQASSPQSRDNTTIAAQDEQPALPLSLAIGNSVYQEPRKTHSPAPSRSSIVTTTSTANIWQPAPRADSYPSFAPKDPNHDCFSVTGCSTTVASTPNRPRTPQAEMKPRQTAPDHHSLSLSHSRTENELQPSPSMSDPMLPPAGALSRTTILSRIGCQPRDAIEEAVCQSLPSTLNKHLAKKAGFWRSSLRKHTRPERVTALHFAALFGEIDMAKRLLAANYNVNEVPYGYSTALTPLHFAIGARQVDMVRFLIANGGMPVEGESWAGLASQVLMRSWLLKTLSDNQVERDKASERIIGVLSILLSAGWDIGASYGKEGNTVLHQAVGFWTGSYKWDLELRAAVTRWLVGRGASPDVRNGDGRTVWDVAVKEGHQDLLRILGAGTVGGNGPEWWKEDRMVSSELAELPGGS